MIPIPRAAEFSPDRKYVDDYNFISHNNISNNLTTETHLLDHLATYNLKMVADKTDKIEILSTGSRSFTVKKLGSKIGGNVNISYRAQQSNAAFITVITIAILLFVVLHVVYLS